MMLTLTASIMYWSLQQKAAEQESSPSEGKRTPEPPGEESAEDKESAPGIRYSDSNASLSSQDLDIKNEESSLQSEEDPSNKD